MTIKALLVDMDGTLVNTAEANYLAYAEALGQVGVTIGRDEFDQVAPGRNWRQFLPALLGPGMERHAAAVAEIKASIYPSKLGHTFVNRGLVALIESSRPIWRTALVTTASRANATAVLGHHGLTSLFDLIVTGSDVSRHKPDPEAYHLASTHLALGPGDCLVIEDSDIGVESAKAFGACFLRVDFTVGP